LQQDRNLDPRHYGSLRAHEVPVSEEADMIAHIAEFEAPVEILESVGMQGFRERVVPVLETQPGFEGYLMLINREKAKFLGVTLWDTEENGRLAGARLEQERRTGVEQMGATSPIPEIYDVIARQ
jgi:heme-degrading monooxygenase HmoA